MSFFRFGIAMFFGFAIMACLYPNSRVAFSRPGSMMQIPSMAYDKSSSDLFSIDVGGEILNFSSDKRKYSGSFALKLQTQTGYNVGFSLTSLADPGQMQELGFHIQKTIFKYGDVTISSGLHDLLYMRDGNDVIQVNDMSFFTVFTNHNKFDNYSLSINFGGGTGKIGYDPQTADESVGLNSAGFLGLKLKTPYFDKNGGLDLIFEYDGSGINLGLAAPVTGQFTFNIGMTHFENLSEFATESREGSDYKALQFDAPALTMGFTFNVPDLYQQQEFIDSPYDVPLDDNLSKSLDSLDEPAVSSLIYSLRDSIVVAYHENKTLHANNLFLKQKLALLMDSTRVFHLERKVDLANTNLIMRHISRSLRYFYAEDYRLALTEIDKVIEINPNIALAYARRGSIYYRLADFQRATMNWNIALKLDPEFKEIQDLLRASKENRLSLTEMEN